MQDASLYAESLQDWKKRTKGTDAEWRRVCAEMWGRIKTDLHYHFGRGCREVKCELYPNG
jgi:hypothetical protein